MRCQVHELASTSARNDEGRKDWRFCTLLLDGYYIEVFAC